MHYLLTEDKKHPSMQIFAVFQLLWSTLQLSKKNEFPEYSKEMGTGGGKWGTGDRTDRQTQRKRRVVYRAADKRQSSQQMVLGQVIQKIIIII